MPRYLTKKKSFWSVVSYSMKQQTVSWLNCDVQWKVDFIWQLATTSSVVRPSKSSKVLPRAKLAPQNGHGHCLVVCCQSDPLQLSESQWNYHIWETFSANWCDAPKTTTPAAGISQQKGPDSSAWQCWTTLHMTNKHFKSWMRWAAKFCLICRIHLTSRQLIPLLQASRQLFAGKTLP